MLVVSIMRESDMKDRVTECLSQEVELETERPNLYLIV